MSSFAVANLIQKEHQQWVIDHMEEDSYLLDLDEKWLYYLTTNDNDIGNYYSNKMMRSSMLKNGNLELLEAMGLGDEGPKLTIPHSLSAISQKAPVFYVNHPEDHEWIYCAVYQGNVVGYLHLGFEQSLIQEENGFDSLSLFGYSEDTIAQLKEKIDLNATDFEALYGMVETLIETLSCSIDFISHHYVSDHPEDMKIIAQK